MNRLCPLCSPDEALDMDEWVLNTEAHPLRIVGCQKRAKVKQQQQLKEARKSKFGFSSLWRRRQ